MKYREFFIFFFILLFSLTFPFDLVHSQNRQEINESYDLLDHFCNQYTHYQYVSSDVDSLLAVFRVFQAKDNAALKDMEEVRCFTCRRIFSYYNKTAAENKFASYNEQYESTIELAARTFTLPPQLISCLILQESVWAPRAESIRGAKGLGQFTKGTRQTIDNIVNGSVTQTEKMREVIAELTEKEKRGEELTSGEYTIKLFYKRRLKNIALQRMWIDSFAVLKEQKKVNFIPTRFITGITSPQNSIIASAFYLRFIFDELLGVGERSGGLERMRQDAVKDKEQAEAIMKGHKAVIDKGSISDAYKNYLGEVERLEVEIDGLKQDIKKEVKNYNSAKQKGNNTEREELASKVDSLEVRFVERKSQLKTQKDSFSKLEGISEEEKKYETAVISVERENSIIQKIDALYNEFQNLPSSDGGALIDFLVLVAALYHQGVGAFTSILSDQGFRPGSNMFKEWIVSLLEDANYRKELANHLKNVRACLTVGEDVQGIFSKEKADEKCNCSLERISGFRASK